MSYIYFACIFYGFFHELSHRYVENSIFKIGEFPLQGIMVKIVNKLNMYTLLNACSLYHQCNCFLCFPKKKVSFTVLTPIKYQNIFGFGIPDAWQRKLTEEPVNTYMESDKKSIMGITIIDHLKFILEKTTNYWTIYWTLLSFSSISYIFNFKITFFLVKLQRVL